MNRIEKSLMKIVVDIWFIVEKKKFPPQIKSSKVKDEACES